MDKKILFGFSVLVIVFLIAWFFVRAPTQEGSAGTATSTPSLPPVPSLGPVITPSPSPVAVAKNLDPKSYNDSTASFIVELANAIKKMVE